MAKKFISLTLLQSYDVKIKKYVGDLMTAANGDITAVQALVNTLIGDDASKSARTIAAEEIAKQLIPENAKEALDTLQEIAAWIQQHPEDVAEINRRITALEGYVGKPADGENAATGLFKAVADAQAAAEDATSKVNGLKDTAISATGGTDVKVDLGGTVGAPTVTVTIEFAEEQDIVDMFTPKGE